MFDQLLVGRWAAGRNQHSYFVADQCGSGPGSYGGNCAVSDGAPISAVNDVRPVPQWYCVDCSMLLS